MKRIIPIIVILISSCAATLSAQEFRYDGGLAGGISCYMGDANQVSPWHRPGVAMSGVFRFLLNYRWSVKTDFSAMQFSGDTRDFDNRFPNGNDYSFETGSPTGTTIRSRVGNTGWADRWSSTSLTMG